MSPEAWVALLESLALLVVLPALVCLLLWLGSWRAQ